MKRSAITSGPPPGPRSRGGPSAPAAVTSLANAPGVRRLCVGLTLLLCVAAAAFLGLLASGRARVEWGKKPGGAGAAPAAPADKDKGEPGYVKDRPFTIRHLKAPSELLKELGAVKFIGAPVKEGLKASIKPGEHLAVEYRGFADLNGAWAFRYQGGCIQARLVCRLGDEGVNTPLVPHTWDGRVPADGTVTSRQGYVVLTSVRRNYSSGRKLEPYLPHLGLIAAGPGGLLPLPAVEAPVRQEYRLLVTAGPPPRTNGVGYTFAIEPTFLFVSPLVGGDDLQAGAETQFEEVKAAKPGEEVVLLEHSWGRNRLELRARFLTGKELAEAGKERE